jgi:hypothetical protein
MAKTTFTPVIGIIPALIFAAIIGTGGYVGATSLMAQMPGNEMSCKVTQFENVKDTPSELLIHTDGCSNAAIKEHVFRADRNELAASFTDPAFTVNDFYKGVAAGKTYNFALQGMTAKSLGMMPKVVKVTEDYMPY